MLWHCFLTHCGLVMPYGNIDLGQHQFRWWLVVWWRQAITWTNVDLSRHWGLGAFPYRKFHRKCSQLSILDMSSKITNLRLQPHHPGTNKLTHWGRVTHMCFGNLTIFSSDNGLSPSRCQAIIWTNAEISKKKSASGSSDSGPVSPMASMRWTNNLDTWRI